MAAYNPEEQENIDELKSWWNTYGTLVIVIVAVFIAGIAGAQSWNYYKKQKTEQALELYDSVLQVQGSGDAKKISDAAGLVMESFPSSGYASRAALISAQASFNAGDLQNTKNRLQWVLDNSGEEELKDMARLRLTGVLLDEKKYDEALRLLEVKHGESFDGLYADRRGDVLAATGKVGEARAAYQMALARISSGSTYHDIVQMKLDALPSAK
jgi:predicted negative regulator of RcsB-dependent stress response